MELIFFDFCNIDNIFSIVGICISSSHLHIFSSSIFTSSHLQSPHFLIFSSSHFHIFSSSASHLPIFASSHLHVSSSSHLLIFSSAHLHIFTSSPLALLPSCPLLNFYFSLEAAGQCQRDGRKREPFRTKWGSIGINCGKIAPLRSRAIRCLLDGATEGQDDLWSMSEIAQDNFIRNTVLVITAQKLCVQTFVSGKSKQALHAFTMYVFPSCFSSMSWVHNGYRSTVQTVLTIYGWHVFIVPLSVFQGCLSSMSSV